jgi:hypothetical protein
MGSAFDDWVFWHFFTVTVDYNSSHIELLLDDVCLTNLFEESLTSLTNLGQFCTTRTQSQSHIATDGQWVSKSWCRAPSETYDQIFITVWQLRSCLCGTPSVTRGRICLSYMLLVLASAVDLGSESLETRDHILLSQIWDFLIRRLLRLVGSWWRYSTLPPHGYYSLLKLSLSLMLRPTVSRPVCLGIKHPSGLTTGFLLPYGIRNTSESCGFVDMGRSLWREDGSVVYNCFWS